jgi:tetratricopeptide (TPR) repeat protein
MRKSRSIVSLVLLTFATALPLSSAFAAVDPAPFYSREPTFSPKVSGLINEAQEKMRAGQTAEAIQTLNLAHSLEPKNPYVLARLAIALNIAGDYQGALDRLRQAQKMGASNDILLAPTLDAMLSMGRHQNVLDLYPDPGPARHDYAAGMVLRARASALQVLGDQAAASAAMARSLAILRDYDGVMTAGRIELMQGNLDAADARADEALKLRPGNIEARMLKIDLAMQRQMSAKARQMSDSLVADHPTSVSALLMRIKVYFAANRADLVESDLDRILADRPDMPFARYFKAISLARRNDIKGAWGLAHSLPKEYVQVDPRVTLNVADMAIAAGFLDSGATLLNVAVSRYPYLLDARLQLADIRLRQNSPQYALNTLTMVQDSADPRVAVLFARIALMKKDSAGARKYIERALDNGGGEELRTLDKDVALKSIADYVARHPANKQMKKQNAVLLLGFGELPRAKAAYEQIVREDPADGLALNNLSWLVAPNDSKRALTLAQLAVKANPASPDYLDTLGSMQMSQSDFKGALVSLQKAHAMSPDDAGISYHLALALEAGGQGAQSRAVLQGLVKRGGVTGMQAAKEMLARKLKMVGDAPGGR